MSVAASVQPKATKEADGLPAETAVALRRSAVTVAVVGLLAAATYLVPGAERLQPWNTGDPVPLARLFERWDDLEVPAFAGAGGSYRAPDHINENMARKLGRAVAANIGESRGATGRRGRGGASGRSTPGIRIDPDEYDGIDVEIDNRAALRQYYDALERTARREAGALTRIGHYGDSSIATDLITHTVRRRLQLRFGDGGHGFVLIARGSMPYLHRDVTHRASAGWEMRQIVAAQDRTGLYGYGGVAYRAGAGAFASFGTDDRGPVGGRVSRFALYYRRDPAGGNVRYRVDAGEPRTLSTRGEAGDAVEVITVADGAHSMEIRPGGNGQIRLYGVALEREGPGVVYDSLGLVGARARRLLNYDREHIARQMELRDLDLLVLGFGGNEADDPIARMPRYEAEFARVIRRMRAARRDMSCLVFSPLDQAGRDDYGRMRTMPTVPLIVAAQRAAALREGCAFYNTFEAMGGEGAMSTWSRARPRLALADFRHATPAGYEVIGNMFYKALLQGFAEHVARR